MGHIQDDLHGNPLTLDNALAVLLIDPCLPLLQTVQGVRLRDNAAHEAHGPKSICLSLELLGTLPLANPQRVPERTGIERQISGVANLPANGGVPHNGVHNFGVGGDGGCADVLNVLAEAHDFTYEAELLLDGIPGGDLGVGAVGAEEVPGVEAGEVLEGAEELVAADGGGYELEVVGYRGVVDDGIGDHDGGLVCRCPVTGLGDVSAP